MDPNHNFYRIKTSWKGINEQGAIVPQKSEDLVMAVNYADAEMVAYKLAEGKEEYGDVDIEIVRTRISELAYNDTFHVDNNLVCGLFTYYFSEAEDSEIGLYQVALVYHTLDETTGKLKNENSTLYMPAVSPAEAIRNTDLYLEKVGESRSYSIRHVKYDKAQSVLVTPEAHQDHLRLS